MNEKAFKRIETEALKILHGTRPMPVVQVGDHAPEPVQMVDARRQQAELFFIRKLEATANEMRSAIRHLDDASMRFTVAQVNEQFGPLREAGLNILRITDQIAFLAGGIKSAIEKLEQE
jgi:hypothetical protein